jgi:hypothetical protein
MMQVAYYRWCEPEPWRMPRLTSPRDLQAAGVDVGKPRMTTHHPSTMCTCQHRGVAGNSKQAHEGARLE